MRTSLFASYVQRHWHGQQPVWLTIFVSLLALRGAHYTLQSAFLVPLSTFSVVLWLLSSAFLLLWQWRGGLRVVDSSLQISGDMVRVYLCYLSLVIILVLTLVQAADALSVLHHEPEEITATVAKPPLLPVSADGSVMYLNGDLDFNSLKALKRATSEFPEIKTLALDSPGGRVFAARALAISVLELGLNTRVEGQCLSACTLVFLAGSARELAPGAKLGFHRYRLASKQPGRTLALAQELDKDRAFFAQRGVSADFVRQMFKSSHDSIWYPSRELLSRAGVLVRH